MNCIKNRKRTIPNTSQNVGPNHRIIYEWYENGKGRVFVRKVFVTCHWLHPHHLGTLIFFLLLLFVPYIHSQFELYICSHLQHFKLWLWLKLILQVVL